MTKPAHVQDLPLIRSGSTIELLGLAGEAMRISLIVLGKRLGGPMMKHNRRLV